MKKLITVILIVLVHFCTAQQIAERTDGEEAISLLTNVIYLQDDLESFRAGLAAIVYKDTVNRNDYLLSLFYDTPKEFCLDTSTEIEIRFSDGVTYNYKQFKNSNERFLKDSTACVQCLIGQKCLQKMTEVPVSHITFLTPAYNHRIGIEDAMKLCLPNLAKLILEKANEEKWAIIDREQRWNAPAIVFDSKVNQQLDEKFLGKYSGEWHRDSFIYNVELYIKRDTSYIVWHIIKDASEEDPKLIKTQALNIRPITDSNKIVMDVCYDPANEGYTIGRRTFYLKLSEDGKWLYGQTSLLNEFFGQMCTKKIEKYKSKDTIRYVKK